MSSDEKKGYAPRAQSDLERPDERLHRLHDGELGTEERAALEAALDEEARLKLEALDEIGALLRDVGDEETEGFDVWAGLKDKIADHNARLHRFHDGEMASEERAAFEAGLDEDARLKLEALGEIGALLRTTSDAATDGFQAWPDVEKKIAGSKVVSFDQHRKRKRGALFAGISTALAAAAALLVLLQPWETAEADTSDCEITAVESTGADVTVLNIPADPSDKDKGASTTVVWASRDRIGEPR